MLKDYIAFDLETTGLRDTDQIIEIGALKVKDGKVVERFMEFVKPDTKISPLITNITGISNDMVANARKTEDIIRDFVDFCEDFVLVGHNIMFDYKFCKKYANHYGYTFEKKGIDTLKIARKIHKDFESKSLGILCEHYHIVNEAAHRAYHDALATAKLYQCMAYYHEMQEPQIFMPSPLVFKVKKVQPITKKQINYIELLCDFHGLCPEKCVKNMTKSEASRYIDSIISEYGLIQQS